MAARILVVNDTQPILELFRTFLEEEGYEVILSSYPLQKLFEVQQVEPDLIILDFVFGDQKIGWQMLQMLKMHRSTASIPVIVCTAAEQAVREQEGYLVSQNVHIVFKPFDIDYMLAVIRQALETSKHLLSEVHDDFEQKNK